MKQLLRSIPFAIVMGLAPYASAGTYTVQLVFLGISPSNLSAACHPSGTATTCSLTSPSALEYDYKIYDKLDQFLPVSGGGVPIGGGGGSTPPPAPTGSVSTSSISFDCEWEVIWTSSGPGDLPPDHADLTFTRTSHGFGKAYVYAPGRTPGTDATSQNQDIHGTQWDVHETAPPAVTYGSQTDSTTTFEISTGPFGQSKTDPNVWVAGFTEGIIETSILTCDNAGGSADAQALTDFHFDQKLTSTSLVFP